MGSSASDIKALYIVVNAGFADEVIEIARECGAGGATILNARGEGSMHKSFMGITVDAEKELVLSLVRKDVAKKIMVAVREKAGLKSPASGVCFTVPVDSITKINKPVPQD